MNRFNSFFLISTLSGLSDWVRTQTRNGFHECRNESDEGPQRVNPAVSFRIIHFIDWTSNTVHQWSHSHNASRTLIPDNLMFTVAKCMERSHSWEAGSCV